MKKFFMLCFTIIFIISARFTFAQNDVNTGTLRILIDGFENNDGKAMIALCNSKECFKNKDITFKAEMTPIKERKAEWVISGLPYGTYSVKIYHDENSNNKLDKNAIGIPKEAYGFSNNARGMFGPPDYEDVKFIFDKEKMTISVTVK